jgi:hypothetical protein
VTSTDEERALAALRASWRFDLLTEMGMVIRNDGGPDNTGPVWVPADPNGLHVDATHYDCSRARWTVETPWKTVGPDSEKAPF